MKKGLFFEALPKEEKRNSWRKLWKYEEKLGKWRGKFWAYIRKIMRKCLVKTYGLSAVYFVSNRAHKHLTLALLALQPPGELPSKPTRHVIAPRARLTEGSTLLHPVSLLSGCWDNSEIQIQIQRSSGGRLTRLRDCVTELLNIFLSLINLFLAIFSELACCIAAGSTKLSERETCPASFGNTSLHYHTAIHRIAISVSKWQGPNNYSNA